FTLSLNKRSVAVNESLLPEHTVYLPEHLLLQMLLGQVDIREQHASNRVHATDEETLRLARCFFPPVAGWTAPLDDLPARTW
ncbi:MAG: hypothetical protein AAGF97_08245, partial [Planctomycetota bacterium]